MPDNNTPKFSFYDYCSFSYIFYEDFLWKWRAEGEYYHKGRLSGECDRIADFCVYNYRRAGNDRLLYDIYIIRYYALSYYLCKAVNYV